jgi:hypothetical protein
MVSILSRHTLLESIIKFRISRWLHRAKPTVHRHLHKLKLTSSSGDLGKQELNAFTHIYERKRSFEQLSIYTGFYCNYNGLYDEHICNMLVYWLHYVKIRIYSLYVIDLTVIISNIVSIEPLVSIEFKESSLL